MIPLLTLYILINASLNFISVINAKDEAHFSGSSRQENVLNIPSALNDIDGEIPTLAPRKQYQVRRFKVYSGWYAMPVPILKLHRQGALRNLSRRIDAMSNEKADQKRREPQVKLSVSSAL